MKINILSPGRFHVCDLARELEKQGFDVHFYSFVPTKRTSKFGLPKHCNRSVFLFVLPLLIMSKLFPKKQIFRVWRIKWQDYITAYYMRRCDVVIAMSGNFVFSLKRAKKRGATVILERGSKHILEQKRILEAIPSLHRTKPVPDINVKRELQGYEIADYIAIAANHVKDSFIKHHYPLEKLFVNPYGVDLSMFKVFPNTPKKYDVIMVGGWSYQKGCDLLSKAIKQMGLSLLHVGAIVDCKFPQDKLFTHIPPVDQTKLINYYNQAKVFVLASRQEGLAMVQMQAVSCNLPLVCSKHSGGEDLKKYFPNNESIIVLDELSMDSLRRALTEALQLVNQSEGELLYDLDGTQSLTWEAYGKRYGSFLKSIVEQ